MGRAPPPGMPRWDGPGSGRTRREVDLAPGVTLSDTLCVYLEGAKAVVVADLHLGVESAGADGAYYPRRQKPVLMRRLGAILERFRPELFVINGDFKHDFAAGLRRERDEVGDVFDFLDSRTQVVLTKGNHDNFLGGLLSGAPLPTSTRVGGCFVCHGHQDLPALRRFSMFKLLGHEHPALKLRDPVGAVVTAPAFIYDETSRTVVLPALSPLAGGTDLLRTAPLSPYLRRLDRRLFRIFAASEQGLLDFGTLGMLEAMEEEKEARWEWDKGR